MGRTGSIQAFLQRRGGPEANGYVFQKGDDFSGFRVADFFGGAADGVEGAEAAEGHLLFRRERLGHVLQEGAEDFLAFDVGEAEGLGEGAGEVGLGQGLLGFFSDVVFDGFGYFPEIGGGFAEDFTDDVVPGKILFADVFVQGGLRVFVQHRGAAGGFRRGDRVGQNGRDGFVERGEELIDRAVGGTEL